MISDKSCHFFASLSVIGHRTSVTHAYTTKHVVLVPPYLSVVKRYYMQKIFNF